MCQLHAGHRICGGIHLAFVPKVMKQHVTTMTLATRPDSWNTIIHCNNPGGEDEEIVLPISKRYETKEEERAVKEMARVTNQSTADDELQFPKRKSHDSSV